MVFFETFLIFLSLINRAFEFSEKNWDEDGELVKRVKSGDKEACAILFQKYHNDLFSFCFFKLWNKEDSEDAVGESFLRSFKKIWTLKDDKKYYGWLKIIAENYCKDLIKFRSRNKGDISERNPDEIISLKISEPKTPSDILEEEEVVKVVRKAIDELEEDEKEILRLKHFEGLRFKDISLVFGIPENTVKTRFYKILVKLSKKLENLKGF